MSQDNTRHVIITMQWTTLQATETGMAQMTRANTRDYLWTLDGDTTEADLYRRAVEAFADEHKINAKRDAATIYYRCVPGMAYMEPGFRSL